MQYRHILAERLRGITHKNFLNTGVTCPMIRDDHPIWANLFRKPEEKNQAIANLWLKTPLFDGIHLNQCLAMVPDMHIRTFSAAEPIFNKGEKGLGVALVLTGQVEVRSDGSLLATLDPGDFFGEVALVVEELRTADVTALKDSEIVFFLRPHLNEWIAKRPRTGAIFMSNLARILARRLGHANEVLGQRNE